MRVLKFNNEKIDIDEKTAIGINYQSYDIKNPSLNKINISNSFNIPSTSNNLRILGFGNNIQTKNTTIYEKIRVDYWLDNDYVIEDGTARIDSISDRINVYIFDKLDLWNDLRNYKWIDFITDVIAWMIADERIPGGLTPDGYFEGSFQDFITPYTVSTSDLTLKAFYSNLRGFANVEGDDKIALKYNFQNTTNYAGGHFSIYIKTFFEFLEYKYSVNFCTAEAITGNIWNDAVAPLVFVPCRNIDIFHTSYQGDPDIVHQWAFFVNDDAYFHPFVGLKDKEDKTAFDLVDGFLKLFNCCIDYKLIDNVKTILMRRFDDIETLAPVVNFSGKLSGQYNFLPIVEGIAQENIIKFSTVFENGDKLAASRTITCQNKNIDARSDLFEIDAYICDFYELQNGDLVADLSENDSFKTFEFFVSTQELATQFEISFSDLTYTAQAFDAALGACELYDLQSEYIFYNAMMQYPKVFEVQKWLTLNDIRNLEYFKQYYIQELNGSYFISKITGFNPEKSLEPTKLTLIKISDKTPFIPIATGFYIDGLGNYYTDGLNNFYF